MTRDPGGFIFCLQRCDIGIKSDDTYFNILLQILQKLWYTIKEVRTGQSRPLANDATNQQEPVANKPIEPQDAATTIKEPRWQTDWTSEYISNSKIDIYGLKTWAGALVALDAKTPELARHYERETAKQTMSAKPVRVFLTQRFPLDPHFDPYGKRLRK